MVNAYKYHAIGVWITSSLSWNKHVEDMCKKANQQIGLLYRQFYQHCSSRTLHLEYAVPVWDPHLSKNVSSIERVQRFALKVCTKQWNSNYDDLLTLTGLPRLSERCKQIFYYTKYFITPVTLTIHSFCSILYLLMSVTGIHFYYQDLPVTLKSMIIHFFRIPFLYGISCLSLF